VIIKEDKMGGTCSTLMEETRNRFQILSENLNGRDRLAELGLDGRKISKLRYQVLTAASMKMAV
jgi:hypothetical protein